MKMIRWAGISLLLGCGLAHAQEVLFTTLGPGETFTEIPAFTIGGGEFWNLSGNNGAVFAAAFTPSATMPFSHADFALLYGIAAYNDLTRPANLDVALASDAEGFPSSTIETIHITNAFGGSTLPAILTATSVLHPVLQQGVQYWFVVQPPDLLHTLFTWMMGPIGTPNSFQGNQFLGLVTSLEPLWSGSNFPTGNSPGLAVYGGVSASSTIPAIAPSGIVSAASYAPPVSSASWISIFGSNLSATTRGWQPSDFIGPMLPISLDGVSVLINGVAASVSYVSPGQLNAELPDLNPSAYSFTLQVITAQGASVPVVLPIAAVAPALFTFEQGGENYASATLTDGTLITPTSPAKSGQVVVLYGSGFGPSSPAVPAGTLVSTAEPLAYEGGVTVTVGGATAQVSYAGITEAGLDQINVTLPQLPPGNQPLVVTANGSPAQTGIVLPTD